MGYIIFSVIAFVVALIVGLACTQLKGENDPTGKTAGFAGFLFGYGVITVIWLIISGILTIHVVDVKEVAVVKTFGRITDQSECSKTILTSAPVVITPVANATPATAPTAVLPVSNLTNPNVLVKCGGLVLTWPWQSIETFNVREDFVYADTRCRNGSDRCLDAGSNEQQDVYITPKLSIKISPDNVQRLASDPGDNYVERVVRPLMKTVIKDITKDYVATDVHLKRSEIEGRVAVRLQNELARYSIEVIRMNFENLDFTDAYNKQIELKVAQTQKALEEEGKVLVIKQQAIQAEEKAKGEAAADVARANGQAQANAIINASITPNLLTWQAIQKFSDNVTIALVPSGEGNLLDPSSFLRPLGAAPAAAPVAGR